MGTSSVGARLAIVMAALAATSLASAQTAPMRLVRAGSYVPFFRTPGVSSVAVRAFRMDARPVTNREFLAFVQTHPQWRRSEIPRVFADDGYLGHWAGDLDLGGEARPAQPVTRVSWFAARAYCEARGARLPTEVEWEYAARASEREPDGSHDAAYLARILGWYARPQPGVLPDVGRSPANYWGLFDLHGLVWEWVADFNAPRALEERGASFFCAGAAQSAGAVDDYAAFMRFAFRSSLRAAFTVRNLGFRCAADAE